MESWDQQYANKRQKIMYMLNTIPKSRNTDLHMIVINILKNIYILFITTYNNQNINYLSFIDLCGIPLDLCTLVEKTRVLIYSLEWKRFFVVKGFLHFLTLSIRTIFSSLVYTTFLWMCPSSWLEDFFLKRLVSVTKHSLAVFNRRSWTWDCP